MNATYLQKPDGTVTDISICGNCGQPARGKSNFDLSQKCCTCYECGAPLSPEDRKYATALYHSECERKRRAILEMKRMERAVLVDDYDGPVYLDGVPGGSFGDGYFADVSELEETLNDQDEGDGERPAFAYCCTGSSPVKLRVEDIIERFTEDMEEDGAERIEGLEDLERAIDVFNLANADVVVWNIDLKRKASIAAAPK